MALPGVVVHHVEGDATGLYGSLAQGPCGVIGGEDRVFGPILPAVECSTRDLTRLWVFVSQVSAMDRCGQAAIRDFLLQLRPVQDLRGASGSVTRGLNMLARHAVRIAGCALLRFKLSQPVCCCLWLFRIRLRAPSSMTTHPACHCLAAGSPGPLCGSLDCVV